MEKWNIDVAVLCIFFARPEQFKQSFETVRRARPRVLLLWQDGPREGREDDVENIQKCREIAENIDWECEVHRNYHEKNMGCDPSTFYSHKWAFSIVEKCIILEDDLVPCPTFFPFCKALLDKYEHDERIDRICGTNLLGKYEIASDYLFSSIGNSWGWASWRRVAEKWEENYEFMDDPYAVNAMRDIQPDVKPHLVWEKECLQHKEEKIPYWEHIIGAQVLLNHRLVIYPKNNMICNVGLSANSTHAPESLEWLPQKIWQYFNTPTYDVEFPLKHPKYMIPDIAFEKKCVIKRRGTKKERFFMLFERIKLKIKRMLKKRGKK
ncbi:MAG: hypothetical protein IJV96_00680 [Clostridia bacterium]|nr:hypothetical protein [Clostridia bacterium]